MAEKIEISLGKEEAERALDALIAKAKQLTEELRKAATALGTPVGSAGGGGTNAMFGGTRGVGGGAGSSAAGVQASATTGGNSGTPLPPGLSWTTMTPDIRASLISQGVFPPGYGGGGAPGGGGGGGGVARRAGAAEGAAELRWRRPDTGRRWDLPRRSDRLASTTCSGSRGGRR